MLTANRTRRNGQPPRESRRIDWYAPPQLRRLRRARVHGTERAVATAPEHRHVHHGRPRVRRRRQLRRSRCQDAEHRSPRARRRQVHRFLRQSRELLTDAHRIHHRPLPAALWNRVAADGTMRHAPSAAVRDVPPATVEERGIRDRPDRQVASRRGSRAPSRIVTASTSSGDFVGVRSITTRTTWRRLQR